MKRILVLLLTLACVSMFAQVLRLGIISDTQPGNNSRKAGTPLFYVEKAFKLMRELGVDGILIAGDLSNVNDPSVYVEIRKIYDEVFGNDAQKPHFMPVMGNHDRSGGLPKDNPARTKEEREKRFMEGLKVDTLHPHLVINGFDVIGRSFEGGNGAGCNADDEAWFRAELAKAIERDPVKPIIVCGHNHGYDTVYGSVPWGNRAITRLFAPYQQVIHFSGHTHYPNEDPRTIHQKDFTSVGTSTLNYLWVDEPCIEYPGRHEGKNMLYMVADDKQVVIRRYQLRDNSEILDNGKPWTLPLPLNKENFVYEPSRRVKDNPPVAPQFPEGAAIAAKPFPEGKPFNGVVITGTAAKHVDFVHHYKIDIFAKNAEGGWDKKTTSPIIFHSDFYRGLNFMKPTFECKIPLQPRTKEFQGFDFQPSTTYRFEMKPCESFGTAGKPLYTEITMPADKQEAKK